MFDDFELKTIAFPLIKMLLILLIGHFAVKLITRIVRKALSGGKLDASLIKFLSKAVSITLHVIVVLSALTAIGVSTTGMLAATSAVAVAVGVGLKDSLANIAGGILLLLSPRFSTGDFISTEGDSGNVVSVDLLHTTINTVDNKQISIPNGVLINSHITNYSKQDKRQVEITFQISYDSDVNKAKEIITDNIIKHSMSITEPDKPLVRVKNYSSSSVDILTRVWCKTPDYWDLYFDLMEQIRDDFDKNGIKIPYNQLDVHINNQ